MKDGGVGKRLRLADDGLVLYRSQSLGGEVLCQELKTLSRKLLSFDLML